MGLRDLVKVIMRWNTIAAQLFASTAECRCASMDGHKVAEEKIGIDGDLSYNVAFDVILLLMSCFAVALPTLVLSQCDRGVNRVLSRRVSLL